MNIKNIIHKELYVCVLFSAIVFAIYFPILNNNFLLLWDDQWMVMNQYTEAGWSLENIYSVFSQSYHTQYSPINALFYILLYSIFGYNAMTFHLFCLLFHLLNTFLIYFLLKKIFMQCNWLQDNNVQEICFLTALLFAIHPLNVEAVAWISASKVLIFSFFYLLATYSYLYFINKKTITLYLLTLLFFCLSLGSKEQAVTFPLWLVLINLFLKIPTNTYIVWISVGSFFIISLLFGIFTMLIQSSNIQNALVTDETYPLLQRIVLACYSLMEYFFKSVFPYKLSFLYPFPSRAGTSLPNWILVYPLLLMIIISTLWSKISKWPFSFGLLLFLIHLSIVLHIIPLYRSGVIADRYMYIPLIGIAFLLSFSFIHIYQRYVNWRNIFLPLMIIYFIILASYSHERCKIWYDSVTLKKEVHEILKEN